MKRILGIVTALALVGVAAAEPTSLDFKVDVAGTTAIAVESIDGSGVTFIEDLKISYDLKSDEPLVFTGESSFLLRYITNKTGEDVTISQDDCFYEPGVGDEVNCEDRPPQEASVGQFQSAYITVAAGALDDGGNLGAVDAFEDALSLNLKTDGNCAEAVFANSFEIPDPFEAYDVKDNTGDVEHTVAAEDFSALQKERAKANIGDSQAGGEEGLDVAFDGKEVDLIGKSDDETEETQIRGAACGPTEGTGMEVTVSPVINTSTLLPEGTTDVALVLTIYETTDN